MNFIQTELPGVMIIEPDVYRDSRGFFLETYHSEKYQEAGIQLPFVQSNHSCSVRDTLRGLHLQVKKPQGKLVRVIEGEIWDVAVDIRPDSPTFRRWTAVSLSATNFRQLYIPPRYAHGFCVISAQAQVEYKCTALYDPADETGIAYNDPMLEIPWPVQSPILSVRDSRNSSLSEFISTLPPQLTPSHR